MRVQSILETIGNTPHVRINRLFGDKHEVWMKLERANPGASIKDRIALAMIDDAEKRGWLKAGMTIVEPTSGNTGIGLALVGAVRGYRVILTMPESMSIERRRYLKALGAELVLTPRELGVRGAIERAEAIAKEIGTAWIPQQFMNDANIEVHKRTTAQEIIRDFPEGFDYLITGVGTGGHITGCGEVLKERFPKMQVLAVEPTLSPVISGGQHSPHSIQGIGAGFIPENLHRDVLDGVITVDPKDAFNFAVRCAKEEGIFVGISTGASLAAVAQKISGLSERASILTFCYDTGERYLSIEGLFE